MLVVIHDYGQRKNKLQIWHLSRACILNIWQQQAAQFKNGSTHICVVYVCHRQCYVQASWGMAKGTSLEQFKVARSHKSTSFEKYTSSKNAFQTAALIAVCLTNSCGHNAHSRHHLISLPGHDTCTLPMFLARSCACLFCWIFFFCHLGPMQYLKVLMTAYQTTTAASTTEHALDETYIFDTDIRVQLLWCADRWCGCLSPGSANSLLTWSISPFPGCSGAMYLLEKEFARDWGKSSLNCCAILAKSLSRCKKSTLSAVQFDYYVSGCIPANSSCCSWTVTCSLRICFPLQGYWSLLKLFLELWYAFAIFVWHILNRLYLKRISVCLRLKHT